MSTLSYNKWWITTKMNLANLKLFDQKMKEELKPTKERSLASHLIGGMYARYSRVVQDVDTCLDQMCQFQRAVTIRKLMNAATQRLHEFKQELVAIDISEFHYIDGALIELKLIPHSIEILHPALFYPRPIEIQELWERIQAGDRIYIPPVKVPSAEDNKSLEAEPKTEPNVPTGSRTTVVVAEEAPKDEKEKKKKDKKRIKYQIEAPKLSLEEEQAQKMREMVLDAIIMIQRNERARQCRLYSNDINAIKKERESKQIKRATFSDTDTFAASHGKVEDGQDQESNEEAAVTIQRIWRGYAARSKLNYDERERRLIIRMTEPSWKSTEEFEKLEKTAEARRRYRDSKIKEYIQSNLDEKDRVLRVIGPGLFEDIGDEIREWFHDWYDNAKNFDKYPSVEKGGTILVVRGETMTPKEWIDEVERKRREKVKKAGMNKSDKDKAKAEKEKKQKEAAAAKKKEAEKKKKEAAKKKKKRFDFDYAFNKPSPQLKALADTLHENHILWDGRNIDDNPNDLPYMDIITDQKCCELQFEIREQVDEMMRLELDLLNDAIARDRLKAKGKKGKGKKKKSKKKKGKRGKKGKKGKKDITAHRTTEDLFQELFDNGIIRLYPKVSMDQFHGDFSYCNWEKRNLGFDPPQTLGDVRQAVVMNCVLPLGVEEMDRPKSVIIAGPRQSGKHILANAVFNATKCVLFDISPIVLAGKYPGKDGMKMLLHLINKMSRLLQPSVIFVDGAEKPFYKKVPKEEKELEPKRLGAKLFKNIVKPITKVDRVLVLGITGQPWAGKPAKMKKAYQRVILIPRPDYGSVFLYWRELLMPFHGLDRDFNFTALTTLSGAYPLSAIRSAALQVLTTRRLIRFKYEPLRQVELLDALLLGPEPITDKEWKKFQKWFRKTPLGKDRAKLMKLSEEKRKNDAKLAESAAKANKKKK